MLDGTANLTLIYSFHITKILIYIHIYIFPIVNLLDHAIWGANQTCAFVPSQFFCLLRKITEYNKGQLKDRFFL